MKKVMGILAAGIAAVGMMAGAAMADEAKTDGFVIGFSNGYWGNTWRAQLVEDFEKRCEEYKEEGIIADYMVSNTQSDATEQLNQINAMIDAGVDALIIDPASPTAMTSAVQKALSQGILVVIGSDPAAYEGTYCVCGNDYSYEILAKWLCEKLGGEGNIVSITGEPGVGTDIIRQETEEAIVAQYPGITELASVPGRWSQTESQSVMTTLLSSYDNIDGVLIQDVMAEGVLKAFENAGQEPCLMTGDYVKSFLNKWAEMDNFETVTIPYACGFICTTLDVTVGLLQGKELDESKLVANPYDENLVNTIMVDPPYCVTLEGEQDAPWLEGYENTKAITLDEALELMEGQADTASLDGYMDRETVLSTYFK